MTLSWLNQTLLTCHDAPACVQPTFSASVWISVPLSISISAWLGLGEQSAYCVPLRSFLLAGALITHIHPATFEV